MNKKIISVLTAAVCAFGASGALCACGDEGGPSGGGITENTKFEDIVSQKITDETAWKAAFEFGDVASMSCKWDNTLEESFKFDGYDRSESCTCKFDFKNNQGHAYFTVIEEDSEEWREWYSYLENSTLYTLIPDKPSGWVRMKEEINLNNGVCIQAHMFDPLYHFLYKQDFVENFSEFTYDEDKNGYIYNYGEAGYDERECIVKFYDGKLAALKYTSTDNSPHLFQKDNHMLLIYDIGGDQKIDIPTDYVDEE